MGIKLAQLISPGGVMRGASATEGPVTYSNVALEQDRVLACIQLGMYLVGDGDTRLALLVQKGQERYQPGVTVEVLATDRAAADACLAALRNAVRKRNVYHGEALR